MRTLLAAVLALALSALAVAAPARAATPPLFDYKSFTNASDPSLTLDRAKIAPPALRLVERSGQYVSGSAWYRQPVEVTSGWETRFGWQLARNAGDSPEGLAFVIQNYFPSALGDAGPGLGFAGIPNSVAIAIHTTPRRAKGEPGTPFVSVHSRGVHPNDATVQSMLAWATGTSDRLGDGLPHELRVRYVPPGGTAPGLYVYLDHDAKPLLTVGVDLGTTLSLPGGRAWIGFTAANGGPPNVGTASISDWSFGPLDVPAALAITSASGSGTASDRTNIGPIILGLRDAAGRPVITLSDLDVRLTSDSARGRFASVSGAAGEHEYTAQILAGESSVVLFYATTITGEKVITARADALGEATQKVTITPGPKAGLGYAGGNWAIFAGETGSFRWWPVDAFGNGLPSEGGIIHLTIEPDGTCQDLTCTATKNGTHTVTATDASGARGTTTLEVWPARDATFTLTAAKDAIAAGESVTFTVTGHDRFDNVFTPTATLTIGPDGTCTGTVCTATKAGPHTVTAKVETRLGPKTVSAGLTVRPGPVATLRLDPAEASVAAGASQGYAVDAADVFGNPVPMPGATLEISPDGNCSLTTCIATVAGPHTVTLRAGALEASAQFTVRPGPRRSLRLSPSEAQTTAGDTQDYAVEVADVYGNPLPKDDVRLEIGPGGECSATGCTATAPGKHVVTARLDELSASATLMVHPRATPTPEPSEPSGGDDAPSAPDGRAPDADQPSVPDAGVPGGAELTPAGSPPAGGAAVPQRALRYVFAGFRAPLRNGNVNRIRAGRVVTLKWRVTDAAGRPVTTLRTARLRVSSCTGHGKGVRTYPVRHLGKGNYRLKWRSRARDAGTCKRLRLDIGDGVSHAVTLKLR